jgi:hypothetical protein
MVSFKDKKIRTVKNIFAVLQGERFCEQENSGEETTVGRTGTWRTPPGSGAGWLSGPRPLGYLRRIEGSSKTPFSNKKWYKPKTVHRYHTERGHVVFTEL